MSDIITYQEMQAASDIAAWVETAIERHRSGWLCRMAHVADDYYRQRNRTIERFVQIMYTPQGEKMKDPTASNLRLKTNMFRRLNVQRCMYSLGKAPSFRDESTKDRLGKGFPDKLIELGRYALIHGIAFAVWDKDHMDVRKVTEMVPVWDEQTGALRAAVYFCRIDPEHPLTAILYEQEGYTTFLEDKDGKLAPTEEGRRAYLSTYEVVPADGLVTNVTEENYTSLPVIPVWGSDQHQSTLAGIRESIDAYDLIKSGFANDVQDCAEIYWIVENYGGMSQNDLAQFRDRLKLTHVVEADTADGGRVTPYTQDVPYAARKELLSSIKSDLYEDFGALDVHTIAASATNDHIDAAYQPLDEEACEFEKHMREAVRNLLALQGIDDEPRFNRSRISNQQEQANMVLSEAEYLDEETVLKLLPNIPAEDVEAILRRKSDEEGQRVQAQPAPVPDEGEEPEEGQRKRGFTIVEG